LLARLHLKMRELDSARERCAEALAIVARLDSPALTYHVHFLMGQIQLALGSRAQADDAVQKGLEAYASHQTARQALETLRSQLRGEELKIAFIKNKAQVYESLVDLSLRRGTPEALEEAFQHMEQAKSRTLLDAMCQSGAPQPVSGESELVRHIRDLREELNWYYHRIEVEQLRQEPQSPERLAQLQQAARSREDVLVRELRHMPETSLREAGLEPQAAVDIARIRESLPREATLVEYFCAGDRVHAAVLTADDLQIYPVTLLSRVENLIHLLQFQLGKFRLGQDYVQKFHGSLLAATNAHLAGLYRELVEPIRSRLQTDHLIVVPHGSLHHVPFHALATGTGYLIDELTVSYAPSASIFATCQAHPRSRRSGMAIFASPDANAPSIQEEASALSATLPEAELFLGPAATRAALQNAAENSRAIHIATHGHFRHDNPMFSGFRLGDGLVTLYDLRSFSLPVDLAVLSGCSTGMNAVTGGDELLGLERGLLSAGAATLLLSLWDLHDETTTSFMKSFYSSYLGNSSVIRGWADAIQHIRKSHPHPFYWAPFVVVGKLG
jgi:CHAT domain-containing protein